MKKEVMSAKQAMSMFILFILGSTLILPTGVEAGENLWIAISVALLGAFPLLLVCARLQVLFPQKNLFMLLDVVYGKILGRIIGVFYIWFAVHLGSVVLRNFGEFITTTSLTNTPQVIPILFLIILCIWGVKLGKELLGRWAEQFVIVTIILIIVTILLLLPVARIENLLPILYNGWKPVFRGAFSVFAFPLAETVVFLLIFTHNEISKKSYKVYLLGLLVGWSLILVTSMTELSILGINLYESSYYPSNVAIARLNIGNFIQRLEMIPAVTVVIGGFVKIGVCLLGACKGIEHVLGLRDHLPIVLPLGILMIPLSLWLYKDSIEMFEWIKYWPYYAFPFQVLIPVLTWIIAELRIRLTA